MSITVEVGLLSGKTVAVEADLDETVALFNLRAQTLGCPVGPLCPFFFWGSLVQTI